MKAPTFEQIRSALAEGDSKNAYASLHPLLGRRASAPKDVEEKVREKCREFDSVPLEVMSYSLFKRFDTPGDGDRKVYEDVYFNKYCARLSAYGSLMLISGEGKEGLENALWAISDLYTWSLPAHMGRVSLVPHTDPNKRDVRYTVDLFAAMLAADIAEALYLFEDRLSPIVVKRVKDCLKKRIFDQMENTKELFFWEANCDTNWASVCAGSIGCAAIYLFKDADTIAPLIHRMCLAMEKYFTGFGKDTVCDEGISYWTYGFRHFIYFADLLKLRTKGAIDLFDSPRVKAVAGFPEKAMLNGPYGASFADCAPEVKLVPNMYIRLKQAYPELKAPSDDALMNITFDKSFAYMTRIMYWHGLEAEGFAPGTFIFPNTQWLIQRCADCAFAAKGGHNQEKHNHNDVGSFILQLGKEPVFTDIGPGEYNNDYFGPGRYKCFNACSRGHSVPIVNGEYQKDGVRRAAEDVRLCETDTGCEFYADISKAYGTEGLEALTRRITFTPNEKAMLHLEDRAVFSHCTGFTERFITPLEPVWQKGALVLGKKVKLTFNQDPGRVNFFRQAYRIQDGRGTEKHTWVIDVNCPCDANIRFEMTAEAL